MKRTTKKNHVPLIIEPHPEDYDGYPFITLIQYRDKHMLTVVNNSTDNQIDAFVLDMCGPEGLNEEAIISIIAEWYEENSERFPLSIEFSKRGIGPELSKIYRTYNIDFVTRVIGPLPKFNMTEIKSIKRRKKKSVPSGVRVEYHLFKEF